ncbi:MAG: DUF134 domain-containing protein [Marinilabiliales bacterium]
MSPRPKRFRRVGKPPVMTGFKPMGAPVRNLEKVSVFAEEYEAIKLADYEKLTQEEAAQRMGISRPTFTRIYESARTKVADVLVNGKSLVFEGGDVIYDKQWYRCSKCHILYHEQSEKKICPECHSDKVENINENIMLWQQMKNGKSKS